MELVKRKFLNIGSTYGANVCLSADTIYSEPESSMYMYNNRPIKRGEFHKCSSCRFKPYPQRCDKFACMKNERKDGKSVYFDRA